MLCCGHMTGPTDRPMRPELRLRDGHVVRSLADAIAVLREHEGRPGVDIRDEVLHRLERAQTEDERREATQAFLVWAKELELLSPGDIAKFRAG